MIWHLMEFKGWVHDRLCDMHRKELPPSIRHAKHEVYFEIIQKLNTAILKSGSSLEVSKSQYEGNFVNERKDNEQKGS